MEPSQPKDNQINELLSGENSSGLVVCFPNSNHLRLQTFSYLAGCALFHKIAVLNKSIRINLPKSALLDQFKIITVKASKDHYPDPLPLESFRYALLLANSIQIQVNVFHLKYPVVLYNIM